MLIRRICHLCKQLYPLVQELQRYSQDIVGVDFAASGMDIPSANFLMHSCSFLKVGSGDSNNVEMLRHLSLGFRCDWNDQHIPKICS